MGQHRETVREVTLGAGATTRVWDAPTSTPIRDLTIWIVSGGSVTPANDLDWEVFYGGGWEGEPFKAGITHVKGVSQGSGAISGSAEICEMIHEDSSLLPSNKNIPFGRAVQDSALAGFPIVVALNNKKASAITFRVVFVSRTVSDVV